MTLSCPDSHHFASGCGSKYVSPSSAITGPAANETSAATRYFTHANGSGPDRGLQDQSPDLGSAGPLAAAFGMSPLVPGLRTGATPSAFSIRLNRSSISSWMRSVFSWRCATSSSALMLTSYSMSDRTRSFVDWRSWLISTKHDKKIASSDTIIVSRPNGNGSNGSNHGIGTTFIAIHTMNHTP